MKALTIDEVIEQLDEIVKWSEENGSRLGYFPALYKRVTIEIKNRIEQGYFDDNERMEKLDVVFANRYLEAYRSYRAGEECTMSWQLAFDATKSWSPIVLQHLFLGMNAHISLDLGIAAATVCPGSEIHALKDDFNKINEVLGSLVNKVQDELATIWPPLKLIDWLAGKLDEKIADFAMEIARDAAWEVALEYAPLNSEQEQEVYIEKRDKEVYGFGMKMYKPGLILRALAFVIRLGELGTVRSKIEVLNEK